MKIGIIGASGKSGSCLVKEALRRGHEVTAIVRDASRLKDYDGDILEKDLYDLACDDLKIFDVVIDAFAAWGDEVCKHKTSLEHLCRILKGHEQVHLMIVGGAGSLLVEPEHHTRLVDTPDFPAEYKPLSLAMAEALDELKKFKGITWTYISPALHFVPDGPRTGKYKIGGDLLQTDSNGKSEISYADYAVAMIDEAESGKHVNSRISVISA